MILSHLSAKATDARGYAALNFAGHDAVEVDEAIHALHHHGLINAFFIASAPAPRFQPSSLTPEGRRVLDRAVRLSAV
jgi:hypothetical protein